MIKNRVEDFTVSSCPVCKNAHIVKIDVYRNVLPNDLNKDIRVPIIKHVNVNVLCPVQNRPFTAEILIQEDVFSKIVQLKKYSGK